MKSARSAASTRIEDIESAKDMRIEATKTARDTRIADMSRAMIGTGGVAPGGPVLGYAEY